MMYERAKITPFSQVEEFYAFIWASGGQKAIVRDRNSFYAPRVRVICEN